MELINHYEEAGAGEPLILLHGNGESCEYFSRQISYFKENYRVIAVDTRGHGKSPRGTAPFTIRQFADDLYAFMRRRGIDKAHILGFSDGGNIALTFVLRYPACVDRLILNGANLYFSGMYAVVCIPVYLRYLFWRDVPEAERNGEEKRGTDGADGQRSRAETGTAVSDPAENTGHRRNERHDEEVPYRTDRAEYSQRGTEVSEGRSFYRRKKAG